MGRFDDFIKRRPAKVQRLVDVTQERLTRRSSVTDDFFPLVTGYDDWDLLWLKIDRTLPVASVMSVGGQVPRTFAGDKLTEAITDYFKIGLGRLWLEKDHRKMMQYEQRIDGVPESWKNHIFGTLEALITANVQMMDILIWEVAATGSCSYTDPRTGITASLTYPTESTLLPAALTGTDLWSDSANANGLVNLRELAEAFYAVHGYFPDNTVISRSQYNKLREQESTKNAYVALSGSAASTSGLVLSPTDMDALLEAREIPPFYVNQNGKVGFDDEVEVEQIVNAAAGQSNISRRRLYPENRINFLTRKIALPDDFGNDAGTMGERALGPTVEGNGASGIWTLSEEVSQSPPIDQMLAVSNGVPAVWDSRIICGQQVDN